MYDIEYYQQINNEERPQAERLADILTWHYKPKSVLDVGCATGLYLKPFMDRQIAVQGIDYSEAVISDEVLQIPRDLIKIHDITKSPANVPLFDLTLCIEVLEHIDASGAAAAIKNITTTSNIIFFSAAVPGQGGEGHINCQPKEYWENIFKEEKYYRDLRDENYLRTLIADGYHMGWLTNNLMVLKG